MVARWIRSLRLWLVDWGIDADAGDEERLAGDGAWMSSTRGPHALLEEAVSVESLAPLAGASRSGVPRRVAQRRELRQRFVQPHVFVDANFAKQIRAVRQASVPRGTRPWGTALLRRALAGLVEEAVTTRWV